MICPDNTKTSEKGHSFRRFFIYRHKISLRVYKKRIAEQKTAVKMAKCMFFTFVFVAFSQKKIAAKRHSAVSKMQVFSCASCKIFSTFSTWKNVDNAVENVEMLNVLGMFST